MALIVVTEAHTSGSRIQYLKINTPPQQSLQSRKSISNIIWLILNFWNEFRIKSLPALAKKCNNNCKSGKGCVLRNGLFQLSETCRVCKRTWLLQKICFWTYCWTKKVYKRTRFCIIYICPCEHANNSNFENRNLIQCFRIAIGNEC